MLSRTKKSTINSFVGVGCSIISSVLSFVLQAVFIRLLGLEYSGINSLFTNVLSILNIAELGTSNAILFRLYKKIAEKDNEGVETLIYTYRKICGLTATVVAVAGICCIPFLGNLVREKPTFSESLWSLFIIVLATSVLQLAWDYKSILIVAKQDRYIKTIINYICLFFCHGLQILVLYYFKNIYLYLLVKLFTTALSGFACGIISRKKYEVRWKDRHLLPKKDIIALIKEIASLAVYKICRTVDASIDTFIISKFIAVTTTAIYGSFMMILNALSELLGAFNDGMIASVGDLYASGEHKKVESVFYQAGHFTFLLYGVCTCTLLPFISPFVKWWIGYTLPNACVYLLLINFYMYGFGMHIATFRNSMGIFVKGWKRPTVTVIFNLAFSLILAQYYGLAGTLLGTFLARTLTEVWYDPCIVCRIGMDISPKKYFIRYVLYMVFVFVCSLIVTCFDTFLPGAYTFVELFWHGILYAGFSLIMFVGIGFVFPEQKYILNRIMHMVKRY